MLINFVETVKIYFHAPVAIDREEFLFALISKKKKKSKGSQKGGREKGGGTWKMSARIPDEFRLDSFPPLTGRQAEMKTLFTVSSLITRPIVATNRKGAAVEDFIRGKALVAP